MHISIERGICCIYIYFFIYAYCERARSCSFVRSFIHSLFPFLTSEQFAFLKRGCFASLCPKSYQEKCSTEFGSFLHCMCISQTDYTCPFAHTGRGNLPMFYHASGGTLVFPIPFFISLFYKTADGVVHCDAHCKTLFSFYLANTVQITHLSSTFFIPTLLK